jgi:hypothetical protein
MTKTQKYYDAAAILKSAMSNVEQAIRTLPSSKSNPAADGIKTWLNKCKTSLEIEAEKCIDQAVACQSSRGNTDD